MNKVLKLAAIALAVASMTTACNNDEEKNSNIQFLSQNAEGRQIVEGDLVYGEASMKFNDEAMGSNVGNPTLLFQVAKPEYPGDLNDCLTKMHTGDHAIVTISCDSIAKYHGASALPPAYVAGQDMKITFDITVSEVKNMDDMKKEADAQHVVEMEKIAAYVAEKGIKAEPTAEGLYVAVTKMGKGERVAAGKAVKLHYTGRLLDGTVFDSSLENGREPLEYVVGQMGLIKGWEMAIDNMPQGTELTAVFPSSLGYGANGTPGGPIPGYSPLRFDIKIVSVK